jgi:hypothetical protein
VPVNIGQSTSTYVDSATASTFVAAMAISLTALAQLLQGKTPMLLALPLGAALGNALGFKITGVVFVPTAMLVFVGAMLFTAHLLRLDPADRERVLRALWYPASFERTGADEARAYFTRTVAFLAIATLALTAVGGYWYIRNFALRGSPVYPIGIQVAETEVFEGRPATEVIDTEYFLAEESKEDTQATRLVDAWFQGWQEWPSTVLSYDPRKGGLGYVWALGGLPALIYLLFRLWAEHFPENRPWARRRIAYGPALLALAVMVAVPFFVRPYNEWSRHTLWIVGAGLPAWALVLHHMSQKPRRLARAAAAAWAVALSLLLMFEGGYSLNNVYTSSYWHRSVPPPFEEDWSVASRVFTWHDPVGYIYPQLSGTMMEDIVRRREAVALGELTPDHQFVWGQVTQPVGEREVYVLGRPTATDDELLAKFLDERPVRYVVWDSEENVPPLLRERALREQRTGPFILFEMVPPVYASKGGGADA